MPTTARTIVLLLCILMIFSCKKGKMIATIAKGLVTDSVTGKPVSGFVCYLSSGNSIMFDTTDVNGMFQLEVTDEWKYSADFVPNLIDIYPQTEFSKRYYHINKSIPVNAGETNTLFLSVDPRDAFLRIHLQNISVHSGKFFADIKVPELNHHDYVYFEKLLPLHDSILIEMPIAGMETVTFNVDSNYTGFDFDKIEATVICPRNDTTDIWVKY